MYKSFIAKKKHLVQMFLGLSVVLSALSLSCYDNNSVSENSNITPGTGSYSCSIIWPEDSSTLDNGLSSHRAIDCFEAGIDFVTFTFYDDNNTRLKENQLNCNLHTGTVGNIPVGANIRLVITASNPSGTDLYRGEQTDISIVENQNTQGGDIIMEHVTIPIYIPLDATTIQEAIDIANNGDVIIVADGIYQGSGNKDLDYKGKKILVKSENGPQNCIIDCQGNGRAAYFNSQETNESILSGFTIKNGFADNGGGIRCGDFSSPRIIKCIIEYNLATNEGGGIYCGTGSTPEIINCLIYENSADFTGGAIQCDWQAYPTLINCTIAHNHNFGVYCNDSAPIVTNCLFYGNNPKAEWTDLYPDQMRYPGLAVNTMASGVQYPNVTYSALNDTYIGEGNITIIFNENFPFVLLYDYHLASDSNAIDAGTLVNCPDMDIEGVLRPEGNEYDIGAYEFTQDN